MKLTPKEQAICDEYSKHGEDGRVRCHECPLNINDNYWQVLECYATVDGRTRVARSLKRYE